MAHRDSPLSHAETRNYFQDFHESLACSLSGGLPTPVFDKPHGPLLLALLDVTYAVRSNRATDEPVARACDAFTRCIAYLGEA